MCYCVDQHQKARDQAVEVLEHYNVVVTQKDIFSRCQVQWLKIITARKRSLRQGNVFTPVCHSVHRGGG